MESIFCGSGMKGSGVKVLCADTAPDIIAMTTAKKVDLHIRVSPFCSNGSQNFPQPQGARKDFPTVGSRFLSKSGAGVRLSLHPRF
jgi:hypothetical protein